MIFISIWLPWLTRASVLLISSVIPVGHSTASIIIFCSTNCIQLVIRMHRSGGFDHLYARKQYDASTTMIADAWGRLLGFDWYGCSSRFGLKADLICDVRKWFRAYISIPSCHFLCGWHLDHFVRENWLPTSVLESECLTNLLDQQ